MSEKKSETIQLPVNYSGKIDNSDQKPSVRTYILESDEKLPMVIVCPGGGYEHLSERESEPVAKKMNALGFHSMVLSYSLAPMEFPAAMCDLAEAVVLARQHSDDWNVDAGRIIVCGFSAGGHLAASLGCYWNSGILQDLLPYSPEETRPNYLVLCYPVVTSDINFCHEDSIRNVLGKNNLDEREFVSIEEHIDDNFPPAFIWHTTEDESVPMENSFKLAAALRGCGIPFEYHLFERGCHGLALATPKTAKSDGSCQERECSTWPELFRNWFEGRPENRAKLEKKSKKNKEK